MLASGTCDPAKNCEAIHEQPHTKEDSLALFVATSVFGASLFFRSTSLGSGGAFLAPNRQASKLRKTPEQFAVYREWD
jgi:hypothetical protein